MQRVININTRCLFYAWKRDHPLEDYQVLLIAAITSLSHNNRAELRKKFDIVFLLAQEKLSYPSIYAANVENELILAMLFDKEGVDEKVVTHSQLLKGLVESKIPWIFWMWCLAHRLELAIKDALKGSSFDDVDEMLLRLYYLYHKSPKKCHQLEEIIVQVRGCILDDSTACKDTTMKSADRAKIVGYYNKWTNAQYLLGCALFIDLLTPCAILSKVMQNDNLDIIEALSAVLMALKETAMSLEEGSSSSSGGVDPTVNPLGAILAAITNSQRKTRAELGRCRKRRADRAAKKPERPYRFQKKAHEEQAFFNDGITDHIVEAETQLSRVARLMGEGPAKLALERAKQCLKLALAHRQKLIKVADRSELGWAGGGLRV
ncbi:hypothetical protein EMCRGX_G017187 [Ephydatia muelleri]